MQNHDFIELLWERGAALYRDMPWRHDTQPYYILVSELMLQQTQVQRVIPKFEAFIARFPDIQALADADLSDVLQAWQGLGYNRRAKYLHDSAKRIRTEFNGHFPSTAQDVMSLPGVGVNTTGAIMAYAYNQPVAYIETNIRTVLLHHFFADSNDVSDAALIATLTPLIDTEHPREFYWALMDYGSSLKVSGVRNNSQSKHYKKQTALKGSLREMRGIIIRELAITDYEKNELIAKLNHDDRIEKAIEGLHKDGLVTEKDGRLHLTK